MGESERSLASTDAVTHPDFTLYQIARFFIVAALEMQSVAVGWQVYEITHRALDLGLVGLAQFLPGVVLLVLGVVRCFNWPASRALLPQLVPMEYFSKAVAYNASTFQAATILGPALGGVLYALAGGPSVVYATATVLSAIALVATLRIGSKSQERPAEEMSFSTVMAGFRYVWREKVVLGSISLDMFAVLLGGAVALLPVYASEILRTGP